MEKKGGSQGNDTWSTKSLSLTPCNLRCTVHCTIVLLHNSVSGNLWKGSSMDRRLYLERTVLQDQSLTGCVILGKPKPSPDNTF
jgi:hypothetical protein